jgi:high-affinity iron transporter
LKYGTTLTASTLCVAAFAVGCGSDEKSSSTEAQATPAEAIEHIGNVRTGLDDALARYMAGEKKTADKLVGDAYLKDFEEVEGPLDKVDHELNEELEDGIREELRGKIQAGAPVGEVSKLVTELQAKLDKAETALR